MCESEVIFSKGEFLSGILDKNQYGATAYSLVHAFFQLYGGTYSGKLLSAFSKIFRSGVGVPGGKPKIRFFRFSENLKNLIFL